MTIRKALAFSYLDKYASLLVFFAASVITARLLTPADVGVFSVTMVLVAFLAPFRDLGASQFLIQQRELDVDSLRAVWTVQLTLGAALGALTFLCRDAIALFYREPRMRDILLVLSINSLIMPFGAMTSAWLTRAMRFDALALIRFSGALSGSTASVLFAARGFGPISLAYGSLAGATVSALVAAAFRPPELPWRPGTRHLNRVVGFGSTSTGVTLLNIASSSAPELLLGRLQGMTQTGLFGRAQSLMSMFERLVLDGLHAVALPMFAKQLRDGGDLSGVFVRAVGHVALAGWCLLGGLALFADPVIRVLYGHQWLSAAPLTSLLCVGMCLHMPALLCSPPLIAKGRVHLVLGLTALNTVINVLTVFLAAHFSLLAVAWGMMLASGLTSLPLLVASQRVIGYRWTDLFTELRRSFIIAAVTLVGPALIWAFWPVGADTPYLQLLSGTATGGVGLLFAAQRWHPDLWQGLLQLSHRGLTTLNRLRRHGT